jgi:hypothetical protein
MTVLSDCPLLRPLGQDFAVAALLAGMALIAFAAGLALLGAVVGLPIGIASWRCVSAFGAGPNLLLAGASTLAPRLTPR